MNDDLEGPSGPSLYRPLTVGSTFSGIGGFDLALSTVGMVTLWTVEVDKAARACLADHFPDADHHEDVTNVHSSRRCPDEPDGCARCLPDVDVLVGGFPCQDISVAGLRRGLAGERSGLFWQFARLAQELKPHWIILENVPGLLSSGQRRDMGAVLGALGELGYGYAYRVLDARHYGVPQRRRRVFIVGHLGEPFGAAVEVLFDSASRSGNPPQDARQGQELAGTLGGGSGSRGWSPDTDRMTFVPEHAFALAARNAKGTSLLSGPGATFSATETETSMVLSVTSEGESTDRGTRVVYVKGRRAGENDPSPESWRLGEVAPTVDAIGHGPRTATAITDGLEVRRLTPTECERLQGFPDGWTAHAGGRPQADSVRYKQLGNAVAVPVVEWIGRRLAAWEYLFGN